MNSLGRAQPQSPSRALTLDVLYQALEQRLTEIEESFDTEADLARLHEWMPAEQTESRPQSCRKCHRGTLFLRTGILSPRLLAALLRTWPASSPGPQDWLLTLGDRFKPNLVFRSDIAWFG